MNQPARFQIPADRPLAFHVRCPRCGGLIAVETAAGTSWNQAILWGYLAQRAHDHRGVC